jgi:hypothetical protein
MGANNSRIKLLEDRIVVLENKERELLNRNEELRVKDIELAELRERLDDYNDEDTLSEQRIKEFVEELLNDPNINCKLLPDAIEHQLYMNVFTIMMGVMKRVLKTSHIKFIGHKIYFEVK